MPSDLTPGVLADDLALVADDIRGSVHSALGTRPYRVVIVQRSWPGGRRGVGTPSDVENEILPAPRVRPMLAKELRPAGGEEEGGVVLTEISLANFTEAELYPHTVAPADEFLYRIDEGHGHGARSRWFVPKSPPRARRGDHERDELDWRIELREVQEPGV